MPRNVPGAVDNLTGDGNPVGGAKKPIDDAAAKALAGPTNADPNALGTPNNPLPYGLVRQSRIKDRVKKADEKDSSLKIKIELDLEVEVSQLPSLFTSCHILLSMHEYFPDSGLLSSNFTPGSRET